MRLISPSASSHSHHHHHEHHTLLHPVIPTSFRFTCGYHSRHTGSSSHTTSLVLGPVQGPPQQQKKQSSSRIMWITTAAATFRCLFRLLLQSSCRTSPLGNWASRQLAFVTVPPPSLRILECSLPHCHDCPSPCLLL